MEINMWNTCLNFKYKNTKGIDEEQEIVRDIVKLQSKIMCIVQHIKSIQFTDNH